MNKNKCQVCEEIKKRDLFSSVLEKDGRNYSYSYALKPYAAII